MSGDKTDNRIENLEVKEFGAHTIEHHTGARHREDSKRSMEAFALMREELRRVREINAELLAALQDLLTATTDLTGTEWPEVKAAHAAIAKATGK